MTNDCVIRHGTVILEGGEVICDVAVKDGKISQIGQDLAGAETIDASGLVVSPGMVDGHAHITSMGGGYRDEWEGYETGTAACAKGGITTIVEMPLNQIPSTTDGSSLQAKYDSGKNQLRVDDASLGGLVPFNLGGGIQELDEGGVCGYKCFLATCGDRSIEGDFQNVDDYSLYEGMRQIAKTGKVLSIHCENAAVTDTLGERAVAAGARTLKEFVESRPVFTEVEAVRRAIFFAKVTGCRINICHCTCFEAVEEVIRAREEGVDVTCETCPHYLYFTTDELDAIGATTKCTPPIRDKAEQEGLWRHLFDGGLSMVVSDHSPCTPDLKDKANPFDAWGGVSSIQTCMDVMFDEGVQKRGMSLERFAQVMAADAADRFGLTQKGRIMVGKDADLCLIKPNSPHTLKAEDLEYRNKISPWIGRTIGCQVVRTILRGTTTYSLEGGVTSSHDGTFILV